MRLWIFDDQPDVIHVSDLKAALEILSNRLSGFRVIGNWESHTGLSGEWKWFYSHDGQNLLAAISR